MSERPINVGLGKIEIAQPPAVLTCIGIGSCVALCIYHEPTRTAALAHVMIPHQNERKQDPSKPAKFADIAVENILEKLREIGLKNRKSLTAKLVGGAQLFHFKQVPNIGDKNVRALVAALRKHNIPIVSKSIGGDHGRSIWFHSETGKVIIKSKTSQIKEI